MHHGRFEICGFEGRAQAVRSAEREAAGLVKIARSGIDGDGGVPEETQETSAFGEIPDVGGDRAAGASGAAHFEKRAMGIGGVVEAEAADGNIEGVILEWQG